MKKFHILIIALTILYGPLYCLASENDPGPVEHPLISAYLICEAIAIEAGIFMFGGLVYKILKRSGS